MRQGVSAAIAAALLTAAPAAALLPAPLRSTPAIESTPTPAPSDGRVPVGLRLADTIAMEDGSHPPAATEMRFDLDRHFRLDLTDIRACKELKGRQSGRDTSPCEGFEEVARGAIEVETLLPEQPPVTVAGNAVAYKIGSRTLVVWAYLPAPVTGALLVPVRIGSKSDGPYGPRLTFAIPKIAGGAGSLTHLSLRFRKGPFSLACPDGRLQSRVYGSFADGSVASTATLRTC